MIVGVTGGAGFIGSHVCKELANSGHQAIRLDKRDGVDVFSDDLDAIFAQENIEAVIHLAGVLGTHELFATPQLAIDVNISGTLKVLEACRKVDARYVGITMPPVFPSVYTTTKMAADHFASVWYQQYGLRVSHVRAYNAYGPGQAYGPGHPQKIVPSFSSLAWQNKPIEIWGDGNQTVDLIWVGDLARMLVDALEFGDDVTFDAGTGRPMTVNQVAEIVLSITKSTAGIEHKPMRDGEKPNTKICATGEGWDRLSWIPTSHPERFIETVESYKP